MDLGRSEPRHVDETPMRYAPATQRLRLFVGIGAVAALVGGTTVGAVAGASLPGKTAGARAAKAGSIVFRKGDNIWVSRPDGFRPRRLTRDGTAADPYRHPTQADNGLVVVARGEARGTYLYRLGRSGRTLGQPIQVAIGLRNPGPLHALASAPAVSPDGKKVALYNTLLQGNYNPSTGIRGLTIVAVFVEYLNAVTGKKIGERHQPGDYYQSPSWIDNRRLLIFAPYNAFAPQVFVDTIGGKLRGWFGDQLDGGSSFDRKLVDEGELTRAGDKLALIRGKNVQRDWRQSAIQIYSVDGFASPPKPLCIIRPPGRGPLAKPTWSPDGTTLAWSNAQGIWSQSITPEGTGCGPAPKLVVRGGSEPDWGPVAAG